MKHVELLPESVICPYCERTTAVRLLYYEHSATQQMDLNDFLCVMATCQYCRMVFRVVIDPLKCLSQQCKGCETMKRAKS